MIVHDNNANRNEESMNKYNQSPKGIKWSAVPSPYFTFSLVFMRGRREAALIGNKVLWNGEIFCLFLHLSINPFPLWAIQPGLRPSQPGLKPSQQGLKPEAWLAGPQAWLAGPMIQM